MNSGEIAGVQDHTAGTLCVEPDRESWPPVPGGTVRVVVGRSAAGERAPAHHHREQATGLDTTVLGVPVHLPALAVTRTLTFTSNVVVVNVVDVPVTVFVSACTRLRTRPASTVYCVAPDTAFQLTGIVAVSSGRWWCR